MRRMARLVLALGWVFLVAPTPAAGRAEDPVWGVYVRLVEGLDGTVADAAATLSAALETAGWRVLADRPVGSPEGCPYEARVLVVHSPGYAATLAPYGGHAAFAVPLRLVVFEDEGGVNVGSVDARNLNRTIVDERVPGAAWEPWHRRLVAAVEAAFPGRIGDRPYGQLRTEGRISRTFGVMAGGPFVDKIEVAASLPATGTSVAEVAGRVEAALAEQGTGEWALDGIYRIDLPELDAAVIGVTGAPIEARAFEIVRHGGDDARKDFACPGLDHAAAFPIELVVRRVTDRIEVQLVDEMFRMKMFFEDAGTVAFAKNMGMPGSIESAIRAAVAGALGG